MKLIYPLENPLPYEIVALGVNLVLGSDLRTTARSKQNQSEKLADSWVSQRRWRSKGTMGAERRGRGRLRLRASTKLD